MFKVKWLETKTIEDMTKQQKLRDKLNRRLELDKMKLVEVDHEGFMVYAKL